MYQTVVSIGKDRKIALPEIVKRRLKQKYLS